MRNYSQFPVRAQWAGSFLPVLRIYTDRLDWTTWATFVLPLLLYIRTLAPTIYNLDSAEFTTAVITNGLVRATGYPLYLVLGKIWIWLPWSADMAYRLNLFSAVCGAGTIFLANSLLRRLNVGPWARVGALGLLAVAPYFWSLSLIAEVYTLHTVFMVGIILALLRWADAPSPGRLALPVLLMTLSMGNHASTILLVPACVWFVLARHPRELADWRVWLASSMAVLFGACIFLILPLRYAQQPAFNYAGVYDANGHFVPINLHTVDGLVWLSTGRSFSGQMFGYSWGEVSGQLADYGRQLWTAFLGIGLGPALVGFVVLLRRDWRISGLLLLMFLANVIFYVNYRVVDKNTMYLPTYLVWALWLGVGSQVLLNMWDAGVGRAWVLRGVLVVTVVVAVASNWRLVDLSADWSTREQSVAILSQLEPNAMVLGWWDTIPAIQYLQLVEGQRPDVLALNRFLFSGDDMQKLILREIDRRPIYINNPPIELLRMTRATAVGTLYRLEPREQPRTWRGDYGTSQSRESVSDNANPAHPVIRAGSAPLY